MQSTNINTQKIVGIIIEICGMVVAVFSVTDQVNRVKFFEETFLVANVNPDVVLGMHFLTMSDANVYFPKQKL